MAVLVLYSGMIHAHTCTDQKFLSSIGINIQIMWLFGLSANHVIPIKGRSEKLNPPSEPIDPIAHVLHYHDLSAYS